MLTLENGARLARHWAPFLWFLFTFFSAKSAEICLSSALGQWRGNTPPPTHTHTKMPKKGKRTHPKKKGFSTQKIERNENDRPSSVRSVADKSGNGDEEKKEKFLRFFFFFFHFFFFFFVSLFFGHWAVSFVDFTARSSPRYLFLFCHFLFFLSFFCFFCHLPTRSFDSITYRVWDWLLPGLQSVAPDRVLLGFARFNFWLIDYYWVLLGFIRVLQSFLAFT